MLCVCLAGVGAVCLAGVSGVGIEFGAHPLNPLLLDCLGLGHMQAPILPCSGHVGIACGVEC